MMGAIYIGLSGMKAYSKGLQTISNNVANLNSPGFKSTAVGFSDIFSTGRGGGLTYLGGNQSERAGGGVRFNQTTIDFTQGDLRESDGDLDLAVDGSGFLVLLDGANTLYARTGRFVVAEDGYIVLEGTEYRLAVLGADGQPEAVSVKTKQTYPPAATSRIAFINNLSSTATEATVSDIAVYDSRGGKQVWKVKFTPVGATAPNEWTVTVTDQLGATVGAQTLKFIGSIVDPSADELAITTSPPGADPLSVVLDFSGGVTSYSSGTTSNISVSSVDGNAAGALTSVSLDDEGKIKLTYANTKSERLGSVALADFRNPQKLDRAGSGLFQNPQGAERRFLTSKQDGAGAIKAKMIEASNVDLSQEFGDLILIQRGFQASSQVVSVSNDMIQQLFGIRGQG